ncbi:hypothetical protein BHAOGJBA_1204 [Methylobacterium hispanicum]|uniref:Uncharacterized protein n=1 Tax=Methylobacterium hispanicum TaxID=270350 RepID=A0AAV4ZHX9_9HYPH|nr:hypothetical protein [Methylobacterium hispanicum]GJD87699.1 hypothetical protein BHAOGJBA_1204 [Methylobacterium hispanicum]
MIIEVPFVYSRGARQPGKRKFKPAFLRGSTHVRLEEVAAEDFPVAFELLTRDMRTGEYRPGDEIRYLGGSLYPPMLGYGGERHATVDNVIAHHAGGCTSAIGRHLPQREPTFGREMEALLELDPRDPGDEAEMAALAARGAEPVRICGGRLWRELKDELLLVAEPEDRFNPPQVTIGWRKNLEAKVGPLDCERHFRLDQLPEALLSLGLDVDPDDPASFGPHVPHLPVIHIPSAIRYCHDQGPAFLKAVRKAWDGYDYTRASTAVLRVYSELGRRLPPDARPEELLEPFRSFVEAVEVGEGLRRADAWRREIDKYEANPAQHASEATGPRP